jgi:ankyrin repeat protein
MKHDSITFVIFLASVLLFTTVSSEAEGSNARTELKKMGYTYTENGFVECAKKGDIEAAKMFLTEGININAKNKKGQTALMRAAEYQRTEVVTLLLEKGADVNFRSQPMRRTALMEASSAGNIVIIKQLAERGAEINAKDLSNNTSLHFASMWGHVEAVSLLIELGAKPDIGGEQGKTPMMVAEQNGHAEVVQILKNAGAKK